MPHHAARPVEAYCWGLIMGDVRPGDQSWIDEVADRFERAWTTGGRPRIEDYLADVAEPRRAGLLEELLRVEQELRDARGESPRPDEYRQRFPALAGVVTKVFSPPPPTDATADLVMTTSQAGPDTDATRHYPGLSGASNGSPE